MSDYNLGKKGYPPPPGAGNDHWAGWNDRETDGSTTSSRFGRLTLGGAISAVVVIAGLGVAGHFGLLNPKPEVDNSQSLPITPEEAAKAEADAYSVAGSPPMESPTPFHVPASVVRLPVAQNFVWAGSARKSAMYYPYEVEDWNTVMRSTTIGVDPNPIELNVNDGFTIVWCRRRFCEIAVSDRSYPTQRIGIIDARIEKLLEKNSIPTSTVSNAPVQGEGKKSNTASSDDVSPSRPPSVGGTSSQDAPVDPQ